MTRYRVCSYVGPQGETCPELLAQGETQCARGHGRPRNRSNWGQRNMAEHQRFARAAKKAQSYCTRCGSTDKLDAHHGPNGPEVLCSACHVATDPKARAR